MPGPSPACLVPAHCAVTLRSVDTHTKRSGPHRAGHHLILYFFQANAMLSLGERMLSLVDGSLAVVPKNTPYAFSYGTGCQYYCLAFETEKETDLARSMLLKRPTLAHVSRQAERDRLRLQMERLQQRLKRPDALPEGYGAAYVNACFTQLLLDVYALQAEAAEKPPEDPGRHLAGQIAAYLDAHFLSPITLDELEKAFFLSRFHLCRLFKREMKTTLFAYVRAKKVEAAADLLLSTDRDVAAICFDSGFANLQSFYSAFKRHTGKTPLKYRKSRRTG